MLFSLEKGFEMIVPNPLTPTDLVRLIHRYNAGWCMCGVAHLTPALVCWVAMTYIITVYVLDISPYLDIFLPLQSAEDFVVIAFLCGCVGIVMLNLPLFFAVRFEADFPVIRNTPILEFIPPSARIFPLTVVCLAPILIILGWTNFRQCFSYNKSRIALACSLYAYLNRWGDWVSYPKFESQRQAVLLLYKLNLIQISRRFGKLQVKAKRTINS